MDVDTERATTDDERMTVDYDDGEDGEGEEAVDVDGDAMMDDHGDDEELMVDDEVVVTAGPDLGAGEGVGGEGGEEMEAEPTSTGLEDAAPFFVTATTPAAAQDHINPFAAIPTTSLPATVSPSIPQITEPFVTARDFAVEQNTSGNRNAVGHEAGLGTTDGSPIHPFSIDETATSSSSNPTNLPPFTSPPEAANLTGQPQSQPPAISQAVNTSFEPQQETTEILPSADKPHSEKTDAVEDDMPRDEKNVETENDQGDDEDYYEEEEGEDDEDGDGDGEDDDGYPHNVHTLPPVILNLPKLGARALFAPLPEGHNPGKLPVWLDGKQEELGEASLSDVWAAVRAELARERLVQSGEMVIVQKQMDLNMGEDDINLQAITFLELVQLHHSCGLPDPVQLHITFSPSRFGARFYAIQKEVKAQEERRKLQVLPAISHVQEGEEGASGEEGYEDDEEEPEDGEADVNEDGTEEAALERRKPREEEDYRQRRARGGDDARAVYGESRREQERERAAPAGSEHPNAVWAHGRLIHPVHIEGRRIIATPAVTEPETVVVAPPPPAPQALPERRAAQDDGDDDVVEAKVRVQKPVDDDKDTVDTEDIEFDMGQYESVRPAEVQQEEQDRIASFELKRDPTLAELAAEDDGVEEQAVEDVEDAEGEDAEGDVHESYQDTEYQIDSTLPNAKTGDVPLDELQALRNREDFLASVPPPITPSQVDAGSPLIASAPASPGPYPVTSSGARTPVQSEGLPTVSEESVSELPSRPRRDVDGDEEPVGDSALETTAAAQAADAADAVDAVDSAANEELDAAEQLNQAADQVKQAYEQLDAKESAVVRKEADLEAKSPARDRIEEAEGNTEDSAAEKVQADQEIAEEDEEEYDYDDEEEEYEEGGDDGYGLEAIAEKGVQDSLEEEEEEEEQEQVEGEDTTDLPPTLENSSGQEISPNPSTSEEPSPTATIDDDIPSAEVSEDITTTLDDPTTETTFTDTYPSDRKADTERDDLLSPVKRSFEDDEDEISSKRQRAADSS